MSWSDRTRAGLITTDHGLCPGIQGSVCLDVTPDYVWAESEWAKLMIRHAPVLKSSGQICQCRALTAGRKWRARSSERAYVSTCEYGAGSNDMPGHQDLINKMGLTLSGRAGGPWPGLARVWRRDFCRACLMSRISSNRTLTGGRVSSAHSLPCAKRHLEPGNVSPFIIRFGLEEPDVGLSSLDC